MSEYTCRWCGCDKSEHTHADKDTWRLGSCILCRDCPGFEPRLLCSKCDKKPIEHILYAAGEYDEAGPPIIEACSKCYARIIEFAAPVKRPEAQRRRSQTGKLNPRTR